MTDLVKHYRQLVGIAKSWAGKNLPGWSEESHQDLLVRAGARRVEGRASASTLSLPQLQAALADYEKRGWPRKPFFADKAKAKPARVPKPVPPAIAHVCRMWGLLHKAGCVQAGTRPAMLAWITRQVGRPVNDLDGLSTAELQALIEAAKAWLARD